MTDTLPTLDSILAARRRIRPHIRQTPVWQWQSDALTRWLGASTEVFLKLELFQYAGSFKSRGALNVMLELSPEQLKHGVTAVSAGNHAAAVSFAASKLGTTAKVVMPKTANPARVALSRSYGAEVVFAEDAKAAFSLVKEIEANEGRVFVHPFEGPLTTAGTGTLGLEFSEEVPNLDAVIVPIGGGGLSSGVAAALKLTQPNCKVFGVEPVGADSMMRSFKSGKPESLDRPATIADSLAAPYALPYSFSVCRHFLDELVLVDDDALCVSLYRLFQDSKLAVEPAGAASTAALLGPLRERLAGKRVGLIVCGANLDVANFTTYLARGAACDS